MNQSKGKTQKKKGGFMGGVRRFVFALLVILALGIISRNRIVQFVIEEGVRSATGLPLKIGRLYIGIREPVISIEDIILLNPSSFSDRVMMTIPQVYVQYHLADILHRHVHFVKIKLYVQDFLVVKDRQGKFNLDTLRISPKSKKSKAAPSSQAAAKGDLQRGGPVSPSGRRQFLIDDLLFRIDRVRYKDYSVSSGPRVLEYSLNINESAQDINELNALVRVIVLKALMKTTLPSVTDVNLESLSSAIGDALIGVPSSAVKTVEKTTQKARQAIESTTEVIKGTVNGLKGLIKNTKP